MVQMRSFKAQINHIIHKKLDVYCLIIPIAINFQEWKKCTHEYELHSTRSQFFCSIDYNIYHTLNAKINT
jgi:hypothetical protein